MHPRDRCEVNHTCESRCEVTTTARAAASSSVPARATASSSAPARPPARPAAGEKQRARLKRSPDEADLLTLWHKRLGHVNHRKVLDSYNNDLILGVKLNAHNVKKTCEACNLGKQAQNKIKFFAPRDTMLPGEYLHTDIITLNKRTRKGEKYAISSIDDASRYAWAELLDKREDIADISNACVH